MQEFTVILNINGEEQSKNIGMNTITTFELDDISTITNMSCNNGAVPTIESNTLTVTNIFGNTTCRMNDSLEVTMTSLDDTETNIVMLSDEELSNTLKIGETNIVNLDLNGKTVTSSVETISNKGRLTLDSSSSNGIITTSGENTRVISSTGFSSSLILKNGYIKGTDVCDVWYCNALNIANYGNLEISPSTETLFEDDIYQNGVYVETNFGIAVWVATGSSATINGGVYKTIKNSDSSPWQHLVCSRCNTLTINDASTIGDGSAIRGQVSGEIIVNGGNFSSTIKETVVMDSGFEGIINLNDGTYVHDSYHTIMVGSGTLNINGGTYTSEQNCALVNISGIVNINGNSKFIASNYSAIVNSGAGNNGVINVNGGIVFSGNSIAFHNNSESGIINICNTTIESAVYDLSTTAGTINYNSNINTWLNGNTPTIKSGTEYINSLDNLVCE